MEQVWTALLGLLAGAGVVAWWHWWRVHLVVALEERSNGGETEEQPVALGDPLPEALGLAFEALTPPAPALEADRAALAEIDAFVALLERRVRGGEYLAPANDTERWRRLHHALILQDTLDCLRAIAAHYQPQHSDPLLALRPLEIAQILHRSSLILLGVVEQSPLGLHRMTLEELIAWFRRAQQVLQQYQNLQQIWERYHLRTLWNTARWAQLVLNPTPSGLAIALGTEAARQLIKRYGIDVVFALLVRQRLELVARTVGYEAMRAFGSRVQYRSSAWLWGCELAVMAHELATGPEVLHALLAELGQMRFPTPSERNTILGYFTDPAGLDAWLAENGQAARALPAQEVDRVAARCTALLKQFHDPGSEAMRRYAEGFAARWGRNVIVPGPAQSDIWKRCCESWAAFLLVVCNVDDVQRRERRLDDMAFAANMPLAGERSVLARQAAQCGEVFVPVVLDPSNALCTAYLEGLVEAVAGGETCPLLLDQAIADVDRFYCGKTNAAVLLRKRWDERYRSLCDGAGVHDDVGSVLRRAILAALAPRERILCTCRAEEQSESGVSGGSCVLVLTTNRLLLLDATCEQGGAGQFVTIPPAQCVLGRRTGCLADELEIVWKVQPQQVHLLVVEAAWPAVSSEVRYAPLVRELCARGASNPGGWLCR